MILIYICYLFADKKTLSITDFWYVWYNQNNKILKYFFSWVKYIFLSVLNKKSKFFNQIVTFQLNLFKIFKNITVYPLSFWQYKLSLEKEGYPLDSFNGHDTEMGEMFYHARFICREQYDYHKWYNIIVYYHGCNQLHILNMIYGLYVDIMNYCFDCQRRPM